MRFLPRTKDSWVSSHKDFMKLVTKPSCFGLYVPFCQVDEQKRCYFHEECEKKYEKDEEEYRYWNRIP